MQAQLEDVVQTIDGLVPADATPPELASKFSAPCHQQ